MEYLSFRGETHGFRRAETLAAGLAAERAFYRRGPLRRVSAGTAAGAVEGRLVKYIGQTDAGRHPCRGGLRESHSP